MLVSGVGNRRPFTLVIDLIFDFLLHVAVGVGVEKNAVLSVLKGMRIIDLRILANHQSPIRRDLPVPVGVAVQCAVPPH